MKSFIVNIDYESQLLKGKVVENSKKIRSEFEYVFFLCGKQDELLVPHRNYSKEYISYIEEKFKRKILLSDEKENLTFWWGRLNDVENEKKINSKVFSYELAKDLGFYPKTVISKDGSFSTNDFKDILCIRNNYGVSGNGNFICKSKEVKTESIMKAIGEGPYIIQNYLKRICDFGVTVNLETQEYFIAKNFVSENGGFKGGALLENHEINELLLPFDVTVEEIVEKIISFSSKHRISGMIQVDNFVYLEGGIKKLYLGVEINYRKTMGYVIYELTRTLGKGSWHIYSKKLSLEKWRKLKDVLEQEFSDGSVVLTSPEKSRFTTIYVLDDQNCEKKKRVEMLLF